MAEQLFHGFTPMASGNQVNLERPQIDRLLEQAIRNPLVTVVAGAGYGKTYAVYSFLKKNNFRTAWLQFSERDNIGSRFWENFVSAVWSISRKSAASLMELGFPVTEEHFERYLMIPRNDVIPEQKYIFVYDDLHLITDKTVLRFLERSITSPFPNITSILISRTEPPLNLMKMVSKGLLNQITEEDLRFSQEEMVSYFKLLGLNPSIQTSASIYRDTEGWAFAIHLAGLSLKNAPPGAAYVSQALKSNIFRLLESEVMSPLQPELQRLLIKLSLIERLAPNLLKEIAGGAFPDNALESIGSFVRFDTYLDAYHIHHLFMDYLKGRQHELNGEEKKEVWFKTAAWCAANDQKMDAISYYEKTGDYSKIVGIVYTLPLLLPTHIARFILEMMDRAPESIYRDYPLCIIIRNRILISLGRFEQSRKELLEILPALRDLPESPEKHRLLMGCNINLGFIGFITAMYSGRYDFMGFFREAAAESRLMGNYVSRPPINGIVLSSYVCRVIDPRPGEMEKTIDTIREMAPYAAEAMGGCMSGMYELARGEFAFFRGDTGEAEKLCLEALRKARDKDQYEIENRALFYLLRIYLSQGNAGETGDILRQLEAELELPYYLNRYSHYDIVTGWYYIQTQQRELAAPWLKSDYEESELNTRAQGLEKLVRARYFLGEKRCPAAIASLENRGDVEPLLMGNIEMKALEAVCRYQLRDREGAFSVLAEAYELASPSGLFMPFTELGKDMRTLADSALKEGAPAIPREGLEKIKRDAANYAKKIFTLSEEFRPAAMRRGDDLPVNAVLSRREYEVLKGFSQGLTREEIASASSLSINTVKSVIRSIYNKLGAVNQADAVRIATEMGILS
ncbi:MAG: LuxR C-terminal-related transcriptional regulator [Treponema sp.]|nr:LuxR C-terminal-related transcriptional regulator [Treponema sp.]